MVHMKIREKCEKLSPGFSTISISEKSVDFHSFQKCDRQSFWNEIFEKWKCDFWVFSENSSFEFSFREILRTLPFFIAVVDNFCRVNFDAYHNIWKRKKFFFPSFFFWELSEISKCEIVAKITKFRKKWARVMLQETSKIKLEEGMEELCEELV